jgi:hypothetical protein
MPDAQCTMLKESVPKEPRKRELNRRLTGTHQDVIPGNEGSPAKAGQVMHRPECLSASCNASYASSLSLRNFLIETGTNLKPETSNPKLSGLNALIPFFSVENQPALYGEHKVNSRSFAVA